MRRHKTDVFNEGAVCTVVGKGRAFDVRGFLEEYFEKMGLVRGNCVFPKNLVKGNKGVAVAYPVMYRGLEDMVQLAYVPRPKGTGWGSGGPRSRRQDYGSLVLLTFIVRKTLLEWF